MPKKAASPIPKGYHTVTPSLFVAGAAKAIDFYKKAFGAQEVSRFAGPDGKIMHAEIRVGDSPIMLADEMPDYGGRVRQCSAERRSASSSIRTTWMPPGSARPTPAPGVQPLIDQFWGDRAGCLKDPFGHNWWLCQRTQELTDDELRKAADAMMSQPQSA